MHDDDTRGMMPDPITGAHEAVIAALITDRDAWRAVAAIAVAVSCGLVLGMILGAGFARVSSAGRIGPCAM